MQTLEVLFHQYLHAGTAAFERDLILQAMEKSDWVIAKASKMLGMSYRTLQYRLDKFNLKKPEAAGR